MNAPQARELVASTLTRPFEEELFHRFIKQLLNHLNDSPERQSHWAGQFIKKAFQEHINHYERIGTYTDPEGRKLDVLVIHLKKEATLERGRTLLRNFAADYLSTGHGNDKDAVLAAYVSPEEDDWRFSFVKLEYALEHDEAGKVKERKELTPARRYSFLVGSHERSHTAQKQFLPLLENDQSDPLLSKIEEAFKIEKVTKEFFERYKALFEKTKAALEKLIERDKKVGAEFKEKSLELDDFAKKLLGQIVFLYFLQKKGWFGVERDAAWGTGHKDFLRHCFNERARFTVKRATTASFFNDILEPLFYQALATERSAHYYDRFDCKIPFLNGGLFEPLQDYDWVHTDILLPDELFSNDEPTKDGDTGTGILDVFDRYNFTVNEAEPLETEVAVDPEMLGKVFENLLPENLRHKGGTYYTPRVIVNYMCQQSLANYLASHFVSTSTGREGLSRQDIETFITLGEILREFEANQRKNEVNRLPETIRKHAREIDRLLAAITVCDPAIGSGAFPVGMMQEIVKARLTLTAVEGMPARTAYDLKRHAIENSLYGVDIDPGAIEIARLRLWLSLVVDEDDFKQIQPLPNLDYKIMQGNSLLEEFEGVKLFDESLLADVPDSTATRIAGLQDEIIHKQQQMLELHARGNRADQLKKQFSKEIEQLQRQVKTLREPRNEAPPPHLFDDPRRESREKLQQLKKLHQEFFETTSRSKKDQLRARLETLEWEFMEARLREQEKTAALTDLRQYRRSSRKPFFLWKLHFVEVFQDKGGFDVVLANPPYVRQEEIKDLKPALKRNYTAYTGTADLYVYFYERAVNLLNDEGVVAFITSNKYFRAGYGEKLRQMLAQNTRIHQIIDFGDAPVFDATAYASIIILQRQFGEANQTRVWNLPPGEPIDSFEQRFNEHSIALLQAELKADGWRLESPKVLRLLEKIRGAGTPFGEYIEGRFYYGLKTGLNEAFVIDRQTRDRLIAEDKSSAEVLKPFLRGRDVKRWYIENPDLWLLFVPWHFPLHNDSTIKGASAKAEKELAKKYPAIYRHLLRFKKELSGRNKDETGIRYEWYALQRWGAEYWEEFEQPKILYQEIATFQAFSYDMSGSFTNNKTFLIPTKDLALLGILNAKLAWWFLHQICSKLQGGALAMQTPYVSQLPIVSTNQEQQRLLSNFANYLVFLSYELVSSQPRDQLMISYFEQLIDALVYELYLPDEIHTAGKQFFAPLIAARLPALDEIKGDKLTALRQIFERLFDRDHIIRQNIFFLDTIESVRIIEGKA